MPLVLSSEGEKRPRLGVELARKLRPAGWPGSQV